MSLNIYLLWTVSLTFAHCLGLELFLWNCSLRFCNMLLTPLNQCFSFVFFVSLQISHSLARPKSAFTWICSDKKRNHLRWGWRRTIRIMWGKSVPHFCFHFAYISYTKSNKIDFFKNIPGKGGSVLVDAMPVEYFLFQPHTQAKF